MVQSSCLRLFRTETNKNIFVLDRVVFLWQVSKDCLFFFIILNSAQVECQEKVLIAKDIFYEKVNIAALIFFTAYDSVSMSAIILGGPSCISLQGFLMALTAVILFVAICFIAEATMSRPVSVHLSVMSELVYATSYII